MGSIAGAEQYLHWNSHRASGGEDAAGTPTALSISPSTAATYPIQKVLGSHFVLNSHRELTQTHPSVLLLRWLDVDYGTTTFSYYFHYLRIIILAEEFWPGEDRGFVLFMWDMCAPSRGVKESR